MKEWKSCLALALVNFLAAGEAAAQVPAEPVTIKGLITNGSGCPLGTVATNISNDKQAFTLTFSDFVAEAGPGLTPSSARKNCILTLTLGVPAGWQYSIGSFYYRGFMGLDQGIQATHATSYSFEGQGQTGNFHSVKAGPLQEDFVFTDEVGLSSVVMPDTWSPCKVERALNINVGIGLLNSSPYDFPDARGIITNDSADGEIKQIWGLSWRRCPGNTPTPATRPIYRLVNNTGGLDHLLSLNQSEGLNLGYSFEGIAFHALVEGGSNLVALTRCLAHGGGHFASTSPSCEGHIPEGILGYIYSHPVRGTSPLYRCQGLALGLRDWLVTLSESECRKAGYAMDGILGYVP